MSIHPPTASEQVGAQSAALLKLAGVQSKLTGDGMNLVTATPSAPGAAPHWPPLRTDLAALAVNPIATNTYTPVAGDADGLPVSMTYAGASTVTLPKDSDLSYAVGRATAFKCSNAAGKITFAAGTGATLVVARTGCASLIPQNPWGTIYKLSANTWELIGPFVG